MDFPIKFNVKADDSELRRQVQGSRLFLETQLTRQTDVDRQLDSGRGLISGYSEGFNRRMISPIGAFMGAQAGAPEGAAGLASATNMFSLQMAQAMGMVNQFKSGGFWGNVALGQGLNPMMSNAAEQARMSSMTMFASLGAAGGGDRGAGSLMGQASGLNFDYTFQAEHFAKGMRGAQMAGISDQLRTHGRAVSFQNQLSNLTEIGEGMRIDPEQTGIMATNLMKLGVAPGEQLSGTFRGIQRARRMGVTEGNVNEILATEMNYEKIAQRVGTRIPSLGTEGILDVASQMQATIDQLQARNPGMIVDDRDRSLMLHNASMQARQTGHFNQSQASTSIQAVMGSTIVNKDQIESAYRSAQGDVLANKYAAEQDIKFAEDVNRMKESFSSVGGFVRAIGGGYIQNHQAEMPGFVNKFFGVRDSTPTFQDFGNRATFQGGPNTSEALGASFQKRGSDSAALLESTGFSMSTPGAETFGNLRNAATGLFERFHNEGALSVGKDIGGKLWETIKHPIDAWNSVTGSGPGDTAAATIDNFRKEQVTKIKAADSETVRLGSEAGLRGSNGKILSASDTEKATQLMQLYLTKGVNTEEDIKRMSAKFGEDSQAVIAAKKAMKSNNFTAENVGGILHSAHAAKGEELLQGLFSSSTHTADIGLRLTTKATELGLGVDDISRLKEGTPEERAATTESLFRTNPAFHDAAMNMEAYGNADKGTGAPNDYARDLVVAAQGLERSLSGKK